MDEEAIDPFVVRAITGPEIHKVVNEYCKDADTLVNNYSGFFCRKCDYRHGFKISKVDEEPFMNGTGLLLNNRWVYNLYTPVRWNKKCKECGNEELVAFQFHFSTDEWEDVKKELAQTPLSEDNMMRKKLANYSFYEFFDGRLSFEKKSLLLDKK